MNVFVLIIGIIRDKHMTDAEKVILLSQIAKEMTGNARV